MMLPYKRESIFSCDDFEIIQCSWTKGSQSPLHGHNGSNCALLVKFGRFKNRTEFGLKSETEILGAGESLTIPLGASHEIECLSEIGVTLHVYSPRLESSLHKDNFSSLTPSEVHSILDLELVDSGVSLKKLALLLDGVQSNSITTSSPYFMNQLFAGFIPQTAIAEKLITQTRATLATAIGSPVFTEIEKQVVEQLGALIGWPETEQDGISVPGASAGNFLAVHCARHQKDPTVKIKGMGSRIFKIYVSDQAHYSFSKAAVALGLGSEAVEKITTDECGRMLADQLRHRIRQNIEYGEVPILIVATAGTTVSGAFDPIRELAQIATEFETWLHVDAAWGGPVLFSDGAKSLIDGVHLADSVTFDAHKFFGSNLTTSFFLTQHGRILFDANDVDGGDYIFHEEGVLDRGRLSWQCGRGADAVSFWTLWKHLGTVQMGRCIDSYFEIREELLGWITLHPRLRIVTAADFLNVCVEVLPPPDRPNDGTWSMYVRNMLIKKNLAMVNFATDKHGLTFLRLILVHPFLQLSHITDILTWALSVD